MEEPENGNNGNADIAVEGPAAAEPEVTAAAELLIAKHILY